MKEYIHILEELTKLSTICQRTSEGWGYARFDGLWHSNFVDTVVSLNNCFTQYQYESAITLTIDESIYEIDEVKSFRPSGSMKAWSININKEVIIATSHLHKVQFNFFLLMVHAEAWVKETDFLDVECPLDKDVVTKIIVGDLKIPFGGPLLQFLPPAVSFGNITYSSVLNLPSDEKIQEHVYFLSKDKRTVNLGKFYLNSEDFSSHLATTLLNVVSRIFTIPICHEYRSPCHVIVDGLRRTELQVGEEPCSFLFYKQLVEVVSWLYEDKIETRKKLFADRLTLEFGKGQSLIKSLQSNLGTAFKQAKERYHFVILERKDAYVKELKDLLKDLRAQSDLYATKIRSLLSNMLRDLLAGLVLVGFTLFTRFSDTITLDKAKLLNYVFSGLAIYYVLSVAIQVIVDWIDVQVTGKELKYWKNVSKELIPDTEFEEHRLTSLKGRRRSFRTLYVIISLFYILIAYACYKYPAILHDIIKSKTGG